MPLKPSGQTPTSSPPREHPLGVLVAGQGGAALAGHARRRTASGRPGRRRAGAGSGRSASWIDDHRHQAVDRDRAGVVGDDQRAALGRDVLDAADLDPEPLLGDRAQRGHQEPLGDLGVEAVLVDDVVAGDAGGAGRPGTRASCGSQWSPKTSRGGVLERRPASRRPGCRRACARRSVVGARRRRPSAVGRDAGLGLGLGCVGGSRGGRRASAGGLRRAAAGRRLRGARAPPGCGRPTDGLACRCRGRGGRGCRSG